MKRERLAYYVSDITGIKYPYYNPEWNIHPNGVKRYSNIGDNHLEPQCYSLPEDEYPYSAIYETHLSTK